MISWFFYIIISILAYFLPGHALLSVLDFSRLRGVSRVVISFSLSLVVVPFCLVAVGNVHPITPSFLWLVGLILALYLAALVKRLRPAKGSRTETTEEDGIGEYGSRVELALVFLGIIILSILFNLPRIDMFLAGENTIDISPSDDYWHLQELVSVARTGIPPRHFFLPDLKMVHYYWSWIYPAALSNNPLGGISLSRSLAFHAFMQTGVFLSLVYTFLRKTISSSSARALGLAFVSIFGGFDAFVDRWNVENWASNVPWLLGYSQISQFATLYIWVPHHVAGGMAFLLCLYLWRHAHERLLRKMFLFGMIFAFMLGTSPWVFLASALFILLWLGLKARAVSHLRERLVKAIGVFSIAFLVGGWNQLFITLSKSGGFVPSGFRVPMFEKFFTESTLFIRLDHWLTLLGLPVVMSWVLLIEIGLPFALYVVWALRVYRRRTSWHRVSVIFPIIFFLLIMLIRNAEGVNNLTMRGMIPAQLVIALCAAMLLDELVKFPTKKVYQVMFGYVLVVFAFAQSISWLLPLSELAKRPVLHNLGVRSVSFSKDEGLQLDRVPRRAKPSYPDRFAYIHWININTPRDAIIVEDLVPDLVEPFDENWELHFRLLERLRFIKPSEIRYLSLGSWADLELVQQEQLSELESRMEGSNVLDAWRHSSWSQRGLPAYFVSWEGEAVELGPPMYQDDFVVIYQLE